MNCNSVLKSIFKSKVLLCTFTVLCYALTVSVDSIYRCNKGEVTFLSDAPLETIKASSDEIKGAVDATQRTFLFSIDVNSFHGFNSGLQREHFNENYLESSEYPKVMFKGKFVEDIDFSTNGIYEVRAKGILDLHGVKQERIVNGTISVKGGLVTIDSKFTVLLEDHNIRIPRVVYQKISPEITINMHAELNPSAEK